MLVVAVISIAAYPFLAFSDLTCHFEDTRIGVFCSPVLPDSKETNLGVAIKRLLHQQIKIS